MELTYINESGEKLTLRQAKPFFLTKLDGAGSVRQTVNTFQAPQQDGAFFISSALDMRNITLEGTIAAGTPNKAYEYRRQFLKIFTPKQQGTLTYRNRQIACVPRPFLRRLRKSARNLPAGRRCFILCWKSQRKAWNSAPASPARLSR